jgi:hypothetical protein
LAISIFSSKRRDGCAAFVGRCSLFNRGLTHFLDVIAWHQ